MKKLIITLATAALFLSCEKYDEVCDVVTTHYVKDLTTGEVWIEAMPNKKTPNYQIGNHYHFFKEEVVCQ